MINAYKTATSLALQIVPIITKPIEAVYSIDFDYTQLNDIMLIMKQYNCTIVKKEIQLFCNIVAGISVSRLDEALYKLNDLPNVEVKKMNNNL